MTRNKNRKESIRKRAAAEGIGVARATTLHDRERNLPTEISEALRREDALSWTLGWRSGELRNFYSRPLVEVPFNTESSDTFKATPHFLVEGGVHKQRFHMLDRISREVKKTGEANTYMVDSDDHANITSLAIMHEMRKMVMQSAGVQTFDELRRYFIKEESVPLRSTPKYEFLFIYDFEFAMLGATKETLGDLKFILEHGHETGIHVIISTEDKPEDVWGLSDNLRTVQFQESELAHNEGGLFSMVYKGKPTELDSGYPFDSLEVADSGPHFALISILDYDGFGMGDINLKRTPRGGLISKVESASSESNSRYMGSIDRITSVLENEFREAIHKELGLSIDMGAENWRLVYQDRLGAFGPHPKPKGVPVKPIDGSTF